MKPIFFDSPDEFYNWLDRNHAAEKEVVVGFYKISTGKSKMSWPQAVDQALCFGWIDGVRHSIDSERYAMRFTPRKPGSNWSLVNIKKVEELVSQGKMRPAGIAAFEKRIAEKTGIYSFENQPKELTDELRDRFIENKTAWEFFENLAPGYKRTAIYWVMSAVQEKTRLSRLDKLIDASNRGIRLK